jgi:hypothetical protein
MIEFCLSTVSVILFSTTSRPNFSILVLSSCASGCVSGYDMLYNAIGAGVGVYTGSLFIAPNKIVYFKEF